MSLLNTTLAADLENGAYTARILEYKEVDEKGRKPYIAVILDINQTRIEDRWYESRIPYIMRNLRAQFGKQYTTCTLQEILDEATKTDFAVIIDNDPQYGRTVSYSAS